MERERIELIEYEIAPILSEYALENSEYEELFDPDTGDQKEPQVWDDFEHVDEWIDYTDLERGYEVKTVIVRRKSDGKYFRGDFMYSPHRGEMFHDSILVEAFPTKVEKIIFN